MIRVTILRSMLIPRFCPVCGHSHAPLCRAQLRLKRPLSSWRKRDIALKHNEAMVWRQVRWQSHLRFYGTRLASGTMVAFRGNWA